MHPFRGFPWWVALFERKPFIQGMLFFFVWTDHLPGWMQDRSCFPLLRIEHYVQMPRYVGQGCPDNKCRRSTPLSGCPLCVSKTNNRERKKGDSQTTGNVREFHLNRMTHQQQIPHINTGNSLTPKKKASVHPTIQPIRFSMHAHPPLPFFLYLCMYVCGHQRRPFRFMTRLHAKEMQSHPFFVDLL